jgi:hypothetical protein
LRWTRTQRIRTAATVPVEAAMVDRAEAPLYLRIAERARHLRELGMSDKAIARTLSVSDKTVANSRTFSGQTRRAPPSGETNATGRGSLGPEVAHGLRWRSSPQCRRG